MCLTLGAEDPHGRLKLSSAHSKGQGCYMNPRWLIVTLLLVVGFTARAYADTTIVTVNDAKSVYIVVPSTFSNDDGYKACATHNEVVGMTLYDNMVIAGCLYKDGNTALAGKLAAFLLNSNTALDGSKFTWGDASANDLRQFITKTGVDVNPPSNPLAQQLAADNTFGACRTPILQANGPKGDAETDDVYAEFKCAYNAHDYRAAEVLGEYLVDHRSTSGTLLADYSAGTFLYQIANAEFKQGNSRAALATAKLGYSHLSASDKALCDDFTTCFALRSLLSRIDPSYRKKFATENAAISRQAEAEIASDEAGMSSDQKQVYENESMENPCHVETYDGGSNYYQVTWWYCKADGGYRKSYTFLNGVLRSTYTP
jgi:hypothetical protein